MNRKRVLILVNDNKPGARREVEALTPWLRERVELTGILNPGESAVASAAG